MTRISDLSDKVYLITGASTGIGAALAKGFAAQGALVAVHYNSNEAAAAAVVDGIQAAGGTAIAIRGDLSKKGAIEEVVAATGKHFGRIDGLINNAGSMVRRCPIADFDDDLFDEVVELNIRSVVNGCRAVIPWLRQAGGGNILNVTSIAARMGGGVGAVFYASSKAFVSNLTRGLAKELVKDNIRVNAVAPGVITTPFHERHTSPEMMEAFVRTIPMGRAGTPEDCVGAFLYLASDELSGYVTGQIIEVNGGQYMP
ncbi:SDR family NAD(P)-dependent oxidoreductase [Telmatospirillum sp. J64-1]|uniref:SDR family NAD(P)-dependent oxidoreductase n=1 Tax=Telmatospirillum sp. J64-1 TaxID=2502183 RepID=UPI00163D7DB5|nr:SDR family NAD(P)-dependent oxidoreductase [Telmatospirillum sp. J64-1]